MTDHSPLTDEELVEIEWLYDISLYPHVHRLIADLRTTKTGADEAIANLTAELEMANAEVRGWEEMHSFDGGQCRGDVCVRCHSCAPDHCAGCLDALEADYQAEVYSLKAEVERLRAASDELQSIAAEATTKAVRSYLDRPAECRCSCKPCSFCDTESA